MAHENSSSSNWDEEGYTKYLRRERHMFAWCLVEHGNLPWPAAISEAEKRYPFEPPDDPYRGLIFHDTSWHWAMLQLVGERYWLKWPELERSSESYGVEFRRFTEPKD